MKKIDLEEEFSLQNSVFKFSIVDGKTKLVHLRKVGGKAKLVNPTQEEVTAYFTQHGYSEAASIEFVKWYSDPDNRQAPWKNRDGKVVKDWKRTARQVWFREDNKGQAEQPKKDFFTPPEGAFF